MPLSTQPLSPSARKLFLSRDEYRTCHVRVADMEERLPAIALNGQFYSFFKSVADREKALDVLGKLFDNGDKAVITLGAKAYTIWVLEASASLDPARQRVTSP